LAFFYFGGLPWAHPIFPEVKEYYDYHRKWNKSFTAGKNKEEMAEARKKRRKCEL
jgi:hypothetical protein